MSSHLPGSDLYSAPEDIQPQQNISSDSSVTNGISSSTNIPISSQSPDTSQQYMNQHAATGIARTSASNIMSQHATVSAMSGIATTTLLAANVGTGTIPAPRVEIKLFVGRLPKQMTEGELTPLFAQYGEVLETVIIRDKASGQHKGSAFIKMGSLTDADKAIRAFHNMKVIDNQLGPIQVKYANGEAERLGLPVESAQPGVDIGKLFVGSLPRGVNDEQVREIFEPYGSIEEIVLMKDAGSGQTKGCAFVKYSFKENAMNAIKNLNGQHHCPGCPRALEVKFAESRRAAPAQIATPSQMPNTGTLPHTAYGMMQTAITPHRATPPAAPSNLNPRSAGGWTEYFTADGRPYYHNDVTKATQWIKPVEFERVAPPPATPSAPLAGPTDVAGPPGANVFVFHIPNEWSQTEVIQNFSPFGRVISCYIATDRTTGRNKGYGFVSFDTVDAAASAVLGMNGFLVGSKRLKVSIKNGEEVYVAHLLTPHAQAAAQAALHGGPMGAYGTIPMQQPQRQPPIGASAYGGYGVAPAGIGTAISPQPSTATTYGPAATAYGANYRTTPY